MAPHVTKVEQDLILAMARRNKTTSDIFGTVEQRRRRQNVPVVNITVLRWFRRGKNAQACGSGAPWQETSSQPQQCASHGGSSAQVHQENARRQTGYLGSGPFTGTRAISAPRATVGRAFVREGLDVKLRRCREKPSRTPALKRERVDLSNKMRDTSLSPVLVDPSFCHTLRMASRGASCSGRAK